MLAVWFILGYALYSTALGFLGALASRMEEASNASTPVTVVAMVSYFVAIFSVIERPVRVVATVATYLPPSAPFVVPLRAAFDAIGPLEIGISMLITIIGIWVLFVDRRPGLRGCRAPDGRPDEAARRVAVRRGVVLRPRALPRGVDRCERQWTAGTDVRAQRGPLRAPVDR